MKKHRKPDEVLFANYDFDSYDGRATVIWRHGRKYFLLTGSHCSCYGLEETGWDPEVFPSRKMFVDYLRKVKHVAAVNDQVLLKLIHKLSRKTKKRAPKPSPQSPTVSP